MTRSNLFPLFDFWSGAIMSTPTETRGSRVGKSYTGFVLFQTVSLFLAHGAHLFIIVATFSAISGQQKRFLSLL